MAHKKYHFSINQSALHYAWGDGEGSEAEGKAKAFRPQKPLAKTSEGEATRKKRISTEIIDVFNFFSLSKPFHNP